MLFSMTVQVLLSYFYVHQLCVTCTYSGVDMHPNHIHHSFLFHKYHGRHPAKQCKVFFRTYHGNRPSKQCKVTDRVGMETYLWCSNRCICRYAVNHFLAFFNIMIYVTELLIMSWGKRKLDCLKVNPRDSTDKAPAGTVPMHAPQTSRLWRGVGEVNSAGEVGC